MPASDHALGPHYSSDSPASGLGVLWEFRELLFRLVARDLSVKYQRSALGLLWTLLNPLIMVLVFVAVFGHFLRLGVESFWAFLISGVFAFTCVQQSLTRSTTVLRGQAALRRSVAFPSEILVLGSLLSNVVEFLVEMVIAVLALMVFHHRGVPAPALLLPYVIFLQILLTAGLMFPLSVFSVMYHDVEHALPAVLRMLFYFTPVFYPFSVVPDAAKPFLYLNPFVGLLRLYHLVLYDGLWPSWALLGGMSVTAVAVFIVGYWSFQRSKDVCVEIA